MNSDKKIMRSVKDLEADLEKYQDLYDKHDNNPIVQSKAQTKIADCIRQLRMWDEIYNVIK
jgi:hypothetical protein